MIIIQDSCINPRYVTMMTKSSNLPVMGRGLTYTVEIWLHSQERTVVARFNTEVDRDFFYERLIVAVDAYNAH